MLFLASSLFLLSAPVDLKQHVTRQLNIESFEEAVKYAGDLSQYDDPEALYLAIQAYAGCHDSSKAIALIETNKQLLKETKFFNKSLEALALSVFKSHFYSTQEPLKLASLAAISLETDARVLDLLLEAFESSSLKVKMMALKGLSHFADEKVKIKLLDAFKMTQHPSVCTTISRIFAMWQDSRILPFLYKKIQEDACSIDEKIQYILVIKELTKEIDEKKLKQLMSSKSASVKMLASYLLDSSDSSSKAEFYLKLLKDDNLFVKHSALLSIIKTKTKTDAISGELEKWGLSSSFELKKGYYYWGLVNNSAHIKEHFKLAYDSASLSQKKALVAILYASGPAHDELILELLKKTDDPHLKLHMGLYLLSGHEQALAVDLVSSTLDEMKTKKLFVVQDPIFPFFVIEDESNSALSISAGHRRYMDKHMRLKIFHLLAIKKLKEAKDVLVQLFKTDVFEVSLDAMVHFWENFGYQDSEYLKTLLEDKDPDLRMKAALVLSFLDYEKDARKYLIENFHKQTYAMQIQILFALSKYREDDVIDFYLKQLKSKYPLLQAVSAGCLFTALYK